MRKRREGWRERGREIDLIESLLRTTQSRKLKPTIQVSCELKLDLAQESYLGGAHQIFDIWHT